jgi:hypothetical protein
MTTKPNQSSLKRKLSKVRKLSVEDLSALSQVNIDGMQEEFEVVMRNQIDELTGIVRAKDPASIRTIYEMSSQIISSASFVKADWVARAAQSLCEVHEIMSAGKWDWEAIGVHGLRTSGEVEIALVMTDRLYVGVGSDHTDRDLERGSIAWSKQVNPNILAPTLWVYDEIADHWDDCVMRSRVDGRLYQDVGVNAFLSPTDILKILKERVPGLPAREFVVFCSTIVALDKELGFGQRWQFELEDPVLGRQISHSYQVEQLLDEIAEPYRVPVVTGKL